MNTEKPTLSIKESRLVDNIITKLQIYMAQNNQTLYSLATTIGFAYQPFYRLIKNRNLPTISSLSMIADHLNCSIEELISDKFWIYIDVIDNLNAISKIGKNDAQYKIYISCKDYLPHINEKFFALKTKDVKLIGVDYCKIYYLTNQINTDGEFIVNYQGKTSVMNVISTSSKFIIVESNNEELRIQQDQIQSVAKFFNNLLLLDPSEQYIHGSLWHE